jgi:hypothetical protein
MNRLSIAKRTQVISALVEGNSINATCRMTGVAKHTVLNLLRDLGCACAEYHHKTVRNLRGRRFLSTSFVERQNLTMPMSMRRFTRLTNGFSKKVENHGHAVALHFMHYNFCRVHKTLRVTPAMEAGLTDHVWSMDELVGLIAATVCTNEGAN